MVHPMIMLSAEPYKIILDGISALPALLAQMLASSVTTLNKNTFNLETFSRLVSTYCPLNSYLLLSNQLGLVPKQKMP